MERRCISCQAQIDSAVCPHCGYPVQPQNEPHQLPVGTVLRDRYQVGKVLGQGGFGITYLGRDMLLEKTVAIKEFYPSGIVNRRSEHSTAVECLTEKMAGHYHQSKDRFLREAKALVKFRDIPEVVDLLDFVEENNTAYIVMEYVRGVDLARYIQSRGGRLSVDETFRILKPVMEALAAVHRGDIVHRDISPDNIILDPMGGAKLLDFGAVRTVEAPDVEKGLAKSTEAILKHGFAPIEQYNTRGSLGPWTDEYAMCATVWYCLTGCIPEEASIRVSEGIDPDWRSIPGLTEQQCAALEKGISVRAKDRFVSMDALIGALFGTAVPVPVPQPLQAPVLPPRQPGFAVTEAIGPSGWGQPPVQPPMQPPVQPPLWDGSASGEKPKKGKKWPIFAAIAAVLVVAILAGLLLPGFIGGKDSVTAGDRGSDRERDRIGIDEGRETTGPTTPEMEPAPVDDPLAGTYDVTLWVFETTGFDFLTEEQIEAFMEANPGIVINASIVGVAEAEAASMILADPASAPDIYCFAQDRLAGLVQAGALAAPDGAAAEAIVAGNDAGSVAAASVAGQLWCYPMTSDNGYYMYYDTSIISPEDAESLEAIIAACEKNGVKFRYALDNAWYTASFFFATGCHSNWTVDERGGFVAVDDTFNSPQGLIAMKGMQKLAQSSCYDSNADIFADAGVVVTGIWNANAAADHFGADLGATDLPSFEVDGKSYHLGSFSGHKLMGVKPQTDARKAAVLAMLAQWLTGEECQLQRYGKCQWGPSNLNAQASEAVQANVSLAALTKQNGFGQPQRQIHGAWWDIARVLGIEAGTARSEQALQAALDDYSEALGYIVDLDEAQKQAWTVIGSIGGTSWDVDFPMTEGPENTWTSEPIDMKAGNEFKVRQGLSWDVNFGVGFNGPNIVVEADGVYRVVFVWDGGEGAEIALVPA